MSDRSFSKEIFPNIQPKPSLAQLEAISSRPITSYLEEERPGPAPSEADPAASGLAKISSCSRGMVFLLKGTLNNVFREALPKSTVLVLYAGFLRKTK